MSHKKYLAALPCAVLWAALPSPAVAQAQQAQQQPQQPPQQQPQEAQQQGMVVARDPQTGQLRAATPAEIRALTPSRSSASATAPAQPAMVTHPGGSRHVRLGERGLVYSVATRGANGKLVEHCVQGKDAVDKAVHAPANAAPATADHEGHRHE